MFLLILYIFSIVHQFKYENGHIILNIRNQEWNMTETSLSFKDVSNSI